MPGLMVDRWVFADGFPLPLPSPRVERLEAELGELRDYVRVQIGPGGHMGYTVGLAFTELQRLSKGYAELAELCG